MSIFKDNMCHRYLATIFFLRLPSDADAADAHETFYNKHITLLITTDIIQAMSNCDVC